MARLTVDHVSKDFGAFRALNDISLAINDGEFVAILGPSGCGKTTLLRQIAGFDRPTAGRILIGDEVVSTPQFQVPPERRRIGIVFQSYALWPHMTVAENVAYGLDVAGVKDPERTARVTAALSLVELDGFAGRMPALLSGGQRQRVALARCLVTEPSLVLLDEPLANLDVHLHASMEREFARFHERTGTTMIYITHHQAEAMALADRVAVMDKGRVLQLAAPAQIYREPSSETVARFIGEGMVVPVEILSMDGGHHDVDLLGYRMRMRHAKSERRRGTARACLRPSALRIVDPTAAGVRARVANTIYRGGHFRVEAHAEASPDLMLHLTLPEPCDVAPGTVINLAVDDGWLIPELTPAIS